MEFIFQLTSCIFFHYNLLRLVDNYFCNVTKCNTCPCRSVVTALRRYVQWSVTCLRSLFQSSVRACSPFTKELFQIIPMHMMNREIILGRKRGFDGVLCNLWLLLTPWVAASRLLAAPSWLKLKCLAGYWLVQHTAPVRAKPDSRPRLQIPDKLFTFCLSFLHLTCHAYTSTHLPIPLLSLD